MANKHPTAHTTKLRVLMQQRRTGTALLEAKGAHRMDKYQEDGCGRDKRS
ncbi:hypothetical protein WN55_00052 [Dufourea novaeangliae]|uniref:Uncharacterized protein n=1 Tax=Dufourea novaeangliae TaxID=178035 RepID=A0A154NWA6_DUFNO|nr:hypothetical protein WN55_00052 [Dufourea novaeangliae]